MKATHKKCGGSGVVRPLVHIQTDDVTGFQNDQPTHLGGILVIFWILNKVNDFLVHTNIDSTSAHEVNLCVDVVCSRLGHNQTSIFVRHSTQKMALWGTRHPVFDHWEGRRRYSGSYYWQFFMQHYGFLHVIMENRTFNSYRQNWLSCYRWLISILCCIWCTFPLKSRSGVNLIHFFFFFFFWGGGRG